jgi:hypothetical protein
LFYLFVEFIDRTADAGQSRVSSGASSGHHAPTPQMEYIPQTIRVEKRALKVFKALAERNDQPVSELLEEIIASALEGESVFDPDTIQRVAQLKSLYGIGEVVETEAESRAAVQLALSVVPTNVTPQVTYSHARLSFQRKHIEPLQDDNAFCVVTPEGTFQMTKAQFYEDFDNVVASPSYQKGEYHYSKTPEKALKYLVNASPTASTADMEAS